MAGLLDTPVTFGLLSALPAVGQALQPSRFPRNPFGDILTAAGGFGAGYLGAQQAQDMNRLRQEQLKGLQTKNALNDLTLQYYQGAQPTVAPPKASPQVFTPAAAPGTPSTPAATPAMPMPSPAPSGYAMSLPTLIRQYQTYSRVPGLQNLAQQTLALIQQQVKGGIGITDTGGLAPLPGAVAANAQVAYGKGLGQTVAENNKNQVVSPGAQVFFGPRTLGQAVAGNGVPGQPYTNPNSPALVNVNTAGETAFSKGQGGALGKQAADLLPAQDKAFGQLSTLQQARALIDAWKAAGGAQGMTAPLEAKVTAFVQGLGLDPTSLHLPKDAGPAQALDAISKKLALGSIGTSNGQGGLPANNFSEQDRKFIEKIQPQISDTPEGWEAKVEMAERMAKRAVQQANMWIDYPDHSQKGYFDFRKKWRDYINANPLFTPEEEAAMRERVAKKETPTTQNAANPYASMSDEQILQELRRQGYIQ